MSAARLSEEQLTRLAKLLRMLGTSFPHERASAGLKIHEFVVAHQVDWDALLRPEPQQIVVTQPAPRRTWRIVAEEFLDLCGYALRGEREHAFISDLLMRGFATLTPRQAQWLADICRRCGLPPWNYPNSP